MTDYPCYYCGRHYTNLLLHKTPRPDGIVDHQTVGVCYDCKVLHQASAQDYRCAYCHQDMRGDILGDLSRRGQGVRAMLVTEPTVGVVCGEECAEAVADSFQEDDIAF